MAQSCRFFEESMSEWSFWDQGSKSRSSMVAVLADLLKFPRKKVGEQGKTNRKEGKREERNKGRDGKEGKGSGRKRKWDLFGQYIEKEGKCMQEEETKVLNLLSGRKQIF